ncbi:YkvA family protein [Sphingobium sp. Sx8-8]|uniref:YkvA family protein n=1 Tax=Sphingobium sp. Sx8-8 TaxID=2933617 RepID=UPI001F5738FE|nr:YkvA family protein [Sphingobium sp. Sx8-8]
MTITRIKTLKDWARHIKRDVIALWLAARDPRVPWYAKTLAAVVAAYAFSPVDLIPDFIPVLGLLDDLLIVPLGIIAVVWLIDDDVMIDLRAKAVEQQKPNSRAGLIAIILIWLVTVTLGILWLWPRR